MARGTVTAIEGRRRARGERQPLPPLVFALAMAGIAFFALPFLGLLWRAPWGSMLDVLGQQSVRTALWLSLRTSLAATVLAVVFGVPLAWLLARVPFRGSAAVRALCLLSMVLPPVVGGVALFFLVGSARAVRSVPRPLVRHPTAVHDLGRRRGPDVRVDAVPGDHRRGGTAAELDRRYEDAARTLGGSRWYVFRRVTMPAIQPALIAGAVLASTCPR